MAADDVLQQQQRFVLPGPTRAIPLSRIVLRHSPLPSSYPICCPRLDCCPLYKMHIIFTKCMLSYKMHAIFTIFISSLQNARYFCKLHSPFSFVLEINNQPTVGRRPNWYRLQGCTIYSHEHRRFPLPIVLLLIHSCMKQLDYARSTVVVQDLEEIIIQGGGAESIASHTVLRCVQNAGGSETRGC